MFTCGHINLLAKWSKMVCWRDIFNVNKLINNKKQVNKNKSRFLYKATLILAQNFLRIYVEWNDLKCFRDPD